MKPNQSKEPRAKLATIKDIAERLQISDATVSRAFTGSSYVSSGLKEKIFRVAKELNYKPNSMAVGLRTRRTNTIALVVPDIRNPVHLDLVRHIESFASEDGYSVTLCDTNESIEKEKRHMDMLSAGLVDGIILVPSSRKQGEDEYLPGMNAEKIVLFNRTVEGAPFDIVKADHQSGIRIAVEHLAEKGHTRIGALVGDVGTSVGHERLEGYLSALRTFSIPHDPALSKFGPFSEENGYETTQELLALPNPPTALLVFQNAMTKGCIAAVQQSGIRVPEDVSIVAIDRVENDHLIRPQLTYVEQPLPQMSREIYEMLMGKINRVEDNPGRRTVEFPVRLQVRGSCAKV